MNADRPPRAPGDAARLQQLLTFTDRTPDEDLEMKQLRMISRAANSRQIKGGFQRPTRPNGPKLTIAAVRMDLQQHGISLRHDAALREFTVNYKNGADSTKYFTDDLQDAYDTGLHMAKFRKATGRQHPSVSALVDFASRKTHPNFGELDMESEAPFHGKALDSITAKVPPVYKLNYFIDHRGKRFTPATPIAITPGSSFDVVTFKYWGLDNYDVHVAFPQANIGWHIWKINYEIIVFGKDGGPSISSQFEHPFDDLPVLSTQGIRSHKRLFRFYSALSSLPKLPNSWQYLQFVG